mmetsp:Transcript_22835/g.53389  ORF Transcript_22835/g.53389 Transcript_22835/m.53389 type:complete len:221 (+) Transcript_22835:117-779(+)|eukprot:CAMPEP_0178414002 /NCGR_PEP_ID=MMETSP0689_2-20121128/22814_1 /TAXON_ID=160604 /ORGANISM="Amphidinium massartii, Strain CS-259" /LENGTH=220 /DNA_ID=CAMNT_0020035283 /DNA_START=110 /DNA_END=772 /DNA_ORIENTATION=-
MPGVNQPPGGYAPYGGAPQYGAPPPQYGAAPQYGGGYAPQQGPDYMGYAQQAANLGQQGAAKLSQLPAPSNPRRTFLIVLAIQAIACIVALLHLGAILTGFLYALLIIAGFFAMRTNYYGTYVLAYALGCLGLGIWTLISALLPMVLDFVTLNWATVLLNILLPISMWLGTWVSWHLYKGGNVQMPQQGALLGVGQQPGQPYQGQPYQQPYQGQPFQQQY